MMKYFVVKAGCHNTLIIEVNKLIEKGWTPLGGACAVNVFENHLGSMYAKIPDLYQAMIKEE